MRWKLEATVGLLAVLCTGQLSAADPTPEQIEFFESKVRPILVERCDSCHSSSAKKIKGNLRLDSREAILKGGDQGPAVVPGKPGESQLIQAIEYKDLKMPPAGKLPANEVALLTKWVAIGAPFPPTRKVNPPKKTVDSSTEKALHWAWQPLANSAPPAVDDARWAINPIDRFVQKRLEEKRLSHATPADPRTLIRRVYLDLIGLPAPPDAVQAFASNPSPIAYEKLIEELLASPQYGERWGRYWLDVARYSDGLGGFLDSAPLPDAWRYRDWVVKAFNDDLPYDQFIKYQIAGDLMGVPESAVATGFLAIGPTYTDDGGDPESIAKTKAETLDDRVDTVTRALLGLTVSCARCHDHKFDPIPQADYYSIAGVFNNTRNVHPTIDTPEAIKNFEGHTRAVKAVEEQLKALAKVKDEADRLAKKKELDAEMKLLRSQAPPPLAKFHGVADSGSSDMPIALRGDLRKPGQVVPRRFLETLSGEARPAWTIGSGRLQLANAIASANNPLTARVIVNRVWQHHFGQALVRTPSNFGILGEKPTHPELLDWLAAHLISSNWSLKSLQRKILLSATYRMSSRYDEKNFRADGDNRLIWRMNPRRLDVEAWRDGLYAVTGELDLHLGGPPVRDILNSPRRTLYSSVSRNGDKLPSDAFLRLFDYPSARATSSERPTSTVPQQYLFLLNSPFMATRAKAFAERLLREETDDATRINRAYRLLYAREPTPEERELGVRFLGLVERGQRSRWPHYAQVLLSSHEFMQMR